MKKKDLKEEIDMLRQTITELVFNPLSEASMIIKTTWKSGQKLERAMWNGGVDEKYGLTKTLQNPYLTEKGRASIETTLQLARGFVDKTELI